MTTNDPRGDGSDELRPETAQHTATYPASPGALPPKKPTGLALAALIVGIAAFILGWIPVLGALVGLVAVILGILALRKRQSKGKALTGVILGSVGALASIGMLIASIALVSTTTDMAAGEATALTSTTQPVAAAEPSEDPSVAPVDDVVVEEVAPELVAPAVPPEYKSALKKAESYSSMMNMSKLGVFGQLTSEYGEQFSVEAGQYAVDNVVADWPANALAKAKSYRDTMDMSPAAIHDQLISDYGEQFTVEEADYAMAHLND
ncbi:Ltp family lipoprotein [Cryobacterium sp. MLB-32]|uniref:Ltp family lipoprotein n=1 Tax=Cryobacterium sp. MLB-32 TaxID=1529318 RepID=UPI000AAE6A58|nr:Ltp family lipoprotein [Cryobacterium sp. MLB-32]